MATIEREVTRELSLRFSAEQREKLEQAASARGQSLNEFAAAVLLSAADKALNPIMPLSTGNDPLDRVIGIFEHEPLMDALMERVRADRLMVVSV